MRPIPPNPSTYLRLGLLTAAMALTACSDPDPSPDPDAEAIEVEPDAVLVEAIREALAAPETPEAALQRFQAQVVRLLDEHDETQTERIVQASVFAVLDGPDDVYAMQALTERVRGRAYTMADEVSPADGTSPREGSTGVCPTDDHANTVYFINGIGTNIFAALTSTSLLQQQVRAASPALETSFRLFYNASGNADEQVCLALALELSQAEDWAPQETHAHASGVLVSSCDSGIVAGAIDFAHAAGQYLALAANFELDSRLSRDLHDIVTTDVTSGKEVVVVAHSQGNFYAHRLAADLQADAGQDDPRPSVGIVSTGSPVSFTPTEQASLGGFALVQVEGDVINAVPGAPPANRRNEHSARVDAELAKIDAGQTLVTIIGPVFTANPGLGAAIALARLFVQYRPLVSASIAAHGFVGSYLSEQLTEPRLGATVATSFEPLRNWRERVGQGELQIMLAWDIPGDIDLHVTEPSGDHVYWSDRQGMSGELDRDDISGTGPENYYVCERPSVAIGDYRVQVNNFGGTTGTRAALSITAGDEFQQLETPLGAANFGDELVDVATVRFDGQRFSIVAH